MLKFLVLAALTFNAFAGFKFPSFQSNNKKLVFVDFKTANYEIKYDLNSQIALVKSTMTFEQTEAGFPVFDAKQSPNSISINGKLTSATEVSTPQNETRVRVINQLLEPGIHEVVIESEIVEGIDWDSQGVSNAFWTSDLEDRAFLEAYIPASFEYDQVKMIFDIEFVGAKANQKIYANGNVTQINSSQYSIEFPEYFNSSSVFYHIVPSSKMQEVRFTYKSIDGRNIPCVIYNKDGGSLNNLKSKTLSVLTELEKDYGSFPHSTVTIYNAGWGGMEYHGATMTDAWALAHELTHSYFARGMMPANGNSGWMDEALASWRDNGYPNQDSVSNVNTRMASHPMYTRMTDKDAYGKGATFMAHLNTKFLDVGGLKPFLKHVIATKLFEPITTEEFISMLNEFYQTDLTPLFRRHIYASKAQDSKKSHYHPYHQKMSLKELKKYL